MPEPMSDKRLKELGKECGKPYEDGSWRAKICEAYREIQRLRAENVRLENALDEATENIRRMHETKDD